MDGSEHQEAATQAEAASDVSFLTIDPIHALIMSMSGVGKTHLLATWEKPILLLLFDPVGKEQPLLDRGNVSSFQKGPYCYYREVFSKREPNKIIARVEYWSEPNPAKPTAYDRWIKRSVTLESDVEAWGIKTVGLDTGTYFEMAARYYSINNANQYKSKGEITADGRLHYGYSMNACEQFIMMRIPNLLMCNSLVLCHEADQKDFSDQGDTTVVKKMPMFPGQLPNKIPGGFSEVWHLYVERDGQTRMLQTRRRPGNTFDCKTLLRLPDPIIGHYEAIKAELIKRRS